LAVHPHLQGELDGFCGIYSAIDATRLALGPSQKLSAQQSERLFKRSVERLRSEGRLEFATTWGISQRLWQLLTLHICASASRMSKRRVRCNHPFPTDSYIPRNVVFAAIGSLTDKAEPLLIPLRSAYNHYSVMAS
jgi:hypothetical protein